jgi:folate-dependent phosphoribosylglycinamide formyltransferase PurN
VLFSGGGRTLENLHERILDGTLPARIGVAISSSSQAKGVERARSRGIACKVVEPARRGDADVFSDEITRELDASEVDLVVLGGFLKLYRFPPRYENRIVNIHPALLPAFGGKGFYGDRVHEAVLRSA